MKIFLAGFSSLMHKEIALALKEKRVEILYWLGSKEEFGAISNDKENFPKTIFHNVFDAVKGIAAPGVDASTFNPPSEELLNKLSVCESITLTMMGRLDLYEMDFNKRKNLYYEYVKYWHGVLCQFRPDAIVLSDIPHTGYNFVIYRIAKILGIRTIMLKRVLIPDKMMIFDDYEAYPDFLKTIEGVKENKSAGDLSDRVREHYLNQTNPKADSTPFYRKKDYFDKRAKDTRLIPGLATVLKNIKKGSLFKTSFSYLKMLFRKRRIMSLDGKSFNWGWEVKKRDLAWNKLKKSFQEEYERLQTKPDYSKNFVYVPLHFQPECSTSPVGGVFADQILMVETIASSLPKNWVVYVKESPIQWAWQHGRLGRFLEYYEKLAKIKNVFLVPIQTSTFELIQKSKAVATVAGTASWEAVLREKPTLIFGPVWYMYCDGVFKISDCQTCRAALDKVNNGFKPDRQKILNFLYAADNFFLPGYPNYKFQTISKLSHEENIKNISRALYEKLSEK